MSRRRPGVWLQFWMAATLLAVTSAIASGTRASPLGDVERGAQLWRKCASCHAVGPGAQHKNGPHLNELFGRAAGELNDYNFYSKPMRRAGADGLVWNRESLDVFLENPKALVSRTRMQFRGVADPTDRADLIAFLRTFSASPENIPESAPTAMPTDPEVDPAILAIEGDPDYGEYLSAQCVTCHRADGADEGIPSITGWPAEDFVVAMHAYKQKARPHPVMQMMASRLSDEEIAGLAAFFRNVEQ